MGRCYLKRPVLVTLSHAGVCKGNELPPAGALLSRGQSCWGTQDLKPPSEVILYTRGLCPGCSGKLRAPRVAPWPDHREHSHLVVSIPPPRGCPAGEKGERWFSGPRDTLAAGQLMALRLRRAPEPRRPPPHAAAPSRAHPPGGRSRLPPALLGAAGSIVALKPGRPRAGAAEPRTLRTRGSSWAGLSAPALPRALPTWGGCGRGLREQLSGAPASGPGSAARGAQGK